MTPFETFGADVANADAQLCIRPPAPRSRLRIEGALLIECTEPRPNAWRRFWYWALLGWRWERVV